jgi:hypothetical protein
MKPIGYMIVDNLKSDTIFQMQMYAFDDYVKVVNLLTVPIKTVTEVGDVIKEQAEAYEAKS